MISKNSNNLGSVVSAQLQIGTELPHKVIPVTSTLISAGAIATRDLFNVHHCKDAAQELGSPHIFMNILTTNGLVQQFVEQWAGHGARINDIKIKLGVPNYPGDEMTFSGSVSAIEGEQIEVTLKGKNKLGTHVSGTVSLTLAA